MATPTPEITNAIASVASTNVFHSTAGFVADTKPFLEWGSFLSTILLGLVGFYGLNQIRLLKADMLLRNERSAKEKAIEASEKFLSEFTSGYFDFQREAMSQGCTEYKGKVGNFDESEFPTFENCPDEIVRRLNLSKIWLIPFNKIEACAAMFTTVVADEQTGFEVIGVDFVQMIRNNYDLYTLIQRTTSKHQPYFTNTIKLYKSWSPRFTERELQFQKSLVENEIRNLVKPEMPKIVPNFK